MIFRFILGLKHINLFRNNLLKRNKEYGGVINIQNNNIVNMTVDKGSNYSISYNLKNSNYEITYHTHAYYPQMPKATQEQRIAKIQEYFKNKQRNKGLYIFECDILRIHPPSPQDFLVCLHTVTTRNKICSMVITYDHIYVYRPLPKLIIQYSSLSPQQQKLFFNKLKNKFDKVYYKSIWGMSRTKVEKTLSYGSNKEMIDMMKSVQKYVNNTTKQERIMKYFKTVRESFYIEKHVWGKDSYLLSIPI